MPWMRSSLLVLLVPLVAAADDWPQWLGPNRDGISTEKVAPWKEAPKVLWRQPVGEGHSSPVVANGRVYLHTKVAGKDEEELAAFDAMTGAPVWRTAYPKAPFSTPFGGGPRATPTVAGGRVVTLGITGVLTCFDAAGGKQIWQVPTLDKFGAKNLVFGVSGSPLVEAGKVLVNVGGKGASVVAFAAEDGAVAWQSQDDAASYASGIAFGEGGLRQAVFLTHDGVVSLNPADGRLNWRYALVDKLSESSTTPVRCGDLLLASSVTVGSAGLKLGTKDGKLGATQVWKNPKLTCYFSTPVPVGPEFVYVVTGAIVPPQAGLHCVEVQTGKVRWSKPRVGKYHASLLRTGDDKLLMLDDAGNLILFQPDAAEYRELARSKVCGPTWAHPALANGRLYVRDNKELICLVLN